MTKEEFIEQEEKHGYKADLLSGNKISLIPINACWYPDIWLYDKETFQPYIATPNREFLTKEQFVVYVKAQQDALEAIKLAQQFHEQHNL